MTHGPLGPATILYLCALANQQDGFKEGTVVGGCRGIAKALYAKRDAIHDVIDQAAAEGVLDDFEWFGDNSRFTCRISGWAADREGAGIVNIRANAAERQAAKRVRDALVTGRDASVTERDSSTPIPIPIQKDLKEASKAADRPEIGELCDQLANAILGNVPDARVKPRSEAWLKDMRLTLDRDERSVERVRFVIGWAHRDSFWQQVVLSPDALRKNFDKMAAKIKAEKDRRKAVEAPASYPRGVV
jgi:hypothetical protein